MPLIEDAAQALGSACDGKRAGSIGTAGLFSFGIGKGMALLGGGLVTTNDSDLFRKLVELSEQSPPGLLTNPALVLYPVMSSPAAYSLAYRFYRMIHPQDDPEDKTVRKVRSMTGLQLALGITLLKRMDAIVSERMRVFAGLRERLDVTTLRTPAVEENCRPAFILLPTMFEPGSPQREALSHQLIANGYHVSMFPELRPESPDYENARKVSSGLLGLPVNNFMSESRCDEMARIVTDRFR